MWTGAPRQTRNLGYRVSANFALRTDAPEVRHQGG